MKKIRVFVSHGVNTFRDAASGKYSQESESVKQIRKDIMIKRSDSVNMRIDRRNIERDIRVSFNKLAVGNG